MFCFQPQYGAKENEKRDHVRGADLLEDEDERYNHYNLVQVDFKKSPTEFSEYAKVFLGFVKYSCNIPTHFANIVIFLVCCTTLDAVITNLNRILCRCFFPFTPGTKVL